MDDYYSDNQPELIHCEYCGENYADTYRICPFCHTGPDGKKAGGRSGSSRRSGGGARVRTNTRGGGYGGARSPLSIIGIVLSVILVIAAIIIVAALAKNALANRSTDSDVSTPTSTVTSQEPADDQEEDNTAMVVTPDGVTLDLTEAALAEGETLTLTATIEPSGWVGQVIWTTSDSAVATVDQSGVVTFVGQGSCTITASAAGITAACTVTCGDQTATEPATTEPSADEPTSTPGSTIVVTAYGNTMDGDFTLKMGDVIPFVASGGSGDYTWSIADPSVASVDANGNCTALASGKTTMTVTSGGESTTVVIRVKG